MDKHGTVNNRKSDFLSEDTEFPLVQSLELPKQHTEERTVAGKKRTVTVTTYERR